MENDLQTVKKYLRKLLCDIVLALISVPPLVLDTCVNVIGLFERRFKDLKFQRFLFCFCFFLHLEKIFKAGCVVVPFTLKKPQVNGFISSPNSLLNNSSKKRKFCSIHPYSRGTTFLVYIKMLKKILTNPKSTSESILLSTGKIGKDNLLATHFPTHLWIDIIYTYSYKNL